MPLLRCALRWFAAGLLVAALGGCVSRPTPAYRQIDRNSEAFRTALDAQIQRELATGLSARAARRAADETVTQTFIQAEKHRRKDAIAPLRDALHAMNRPRGCWAYTVTTRTTSAKGTSLKVVRFDPFQPEERLFTLLSLNGRTPTDAEQAAFRKDQLKRWKRSTARARAQRDANGIDNNALSSALQVHAEDPDDPAGAQTFTFERPSQTIVPLGTIPPRRETYVVSGAPGVLASRRRTFLAPSTALGIHFEAFDEHVFYALQDPSLPPFLSRREVVANISFAGLGGGEVHTESTYSDYRRVKCYDDRFAVLVGDALPTDDLTP